VDRLAGGTPQPISSIRDRNRAVPSALEAVIRRALAFLNQPPLKPSQRREDIEDELARSAR
jgi:hypothetical protein